jgi:hypothetical protein
MGILAPFFLSALAQNLEAYVAVAPRAHQTARYTAELKLIDGFQISRRFLREPRLRPQALANNQIFAAPVESLNVL